MANIKSEQKRLEVRRRNNARNSAAKSETRTAIKKAEAALAAGNKEEATKLVNAALSLLDKLGQANVISTNSALRKKAHLQKELGKLN